MPAGVESRGLLISKTKGTNMLTGKRVVIAVLSSAVAVTLTAAGSATTSVTRQRIAIEERASVVGDGSFELIPLTKGLLNHDSGGVTLAATVKQRTFIRAGLVVRPIVAVSTLTSKLGTLKLSQSVFSVDLSDGYSSDRGTWKIAAGTGEYAGVTGSGSFAAVGLPGGAGQVLMRQEGFISKA
jgi:hypothetical protein